MILSKLSIGGQESIKKTMQLIDKNGTGTAVIVDEQRRVCGLVTDGDIRRAILKGKGLDTPVIQIANKSPLCLKITGPGEDPEQAINRRDFIHAIERKGLNLELTGNLLVPVVDEQGSLTGAVLLSKDRRGLKCRRVDGRTASTRAVRRLLIIGGAGYLGSVLAREALEQGLSVTVLDNMMYGDAGLRAFSGRKDFSLRVGDMRSIEDVVGAVTRCDAVIHLAAVVGDPASAIDPQRTIETNYHSAKMITDISKYHQINRLIFASTCSVYGKSTAPDQLLSEEAELNPVSLYAKTKIEAEKAIIDATDDNFSPVIFRMATLYGYSERMRFDLVVNILAAKGYFDRVLPIFGGDQYRPLIHVADAARAYLACLRAPIENIRGEIFNVGSNSQNYKLHDLGKQIASLIDDASLDVRKTDTDERSYCVDFSKLKERLGFEPEYTVETGVKELLDRFKEGRFADYQDSKYSNYKYIVSKGSVTTTDAVDD